MCTLSVILISLLCAHAGGHLSKEAVEQKKKEEAKLKLQQHFQRQLPAEINGQDVDEKNGTNSCRACDIYLGRIALKPCGHAKFWFGCVKKLRAKSVTVAKFLKCPINDCLYLAKDWVLLRNVSA